MRPFKIIVAVALVVVSGLVAALPAAASAAVLGAEISQTSVWSTGYGADVVITNGGDAASNGWVVEFDLPSGTSVANSWSSVRTQSGQHYRFESMSWNAVIQPGDSTSFGFNASGTGTPINCTINGNPCLGGGGDTQAPSSPTGLQVTGVTSTSLSVAWTAASDDTGVVEYDVLLDGAVRASVPGTSAVVAELAPATTYTIAVRARDAAGNESGLSATASVTTLPGGGGGSIVDVSTAAGLSAALAAAQPGQTIRLAPGTYQGAFLAQRGGTAAQPITLTGPATAILSNDGPSGSGPSCAAPTPGWDSGYGLWLFQAPYWNLTGFTVAQAKKGIVLDHSPHVSISGVWVHDIEEEGVHFRRSSADGVISGSRVDHTGTVKPQYGEGVYIGSANSNWGCFGDTGGVDRSDRVQVRDNHIGPYVAAEAIDVKEGTYAGVISGNTFDGTGLSGQNSADSWVDVKGIDYLIEGNTGTFTSPGVFANGYETHNPATTPALQNGCGNVWRDNASDLGGVGQYAIKVTSTSKCQGNLNLVYASNTVSNAVNGLTNIAVTP